MFYVMDIVLLYHTLRHLRFRQIVYQVKNKLKKEKWQFYESPDNSKLNILYPIVKPRCMQNETFTFLNLKASFSSWDDVSKGMLWAYNLNYMDWLLQEDLDFKIGSKWIDKFIKDCFCNKIGLDPYPIALRGINWIKFITINVHKLSIEKRKFWNDSLYSQYKLLVNKLEYHLLGNHLLEDAYSLFIAAIYFKDKNFYKLSVKLLHQELSEQILPDGAHYEQSPMYHCILLDRLLDCYNFSVNNVHWTGQVALNDFLSEKAMLMLGHLSSVIYTDGQIPLLNDSAMGIAPTSTQLFDYAKRLGLVWNAVNMQECGFRKLKNQRMEIIVDIGNITATYQPGHSHADTFNYELRIDGRPFIVDTGISTYDKTERRQLERSTKAHNTVSVKGRDSSEIWGGFRMGKRAHVKVLEDTSMSVKAIHNGFGKVGLHTRTFILNYDSFVIHDEISMNNSAISYIHFAPDVQILAVSPTEIHTDRALILFFGACSIELKMGTVSTEYNKFRPSSIVLVHFVGNCGYKILYNS